MDTELNTETQITTLPMDKTLIFTAYGPKLKVALDFPPGFGRTKQSFKADADINTILARYVKTGTLEFTQKHEARYGDATGIDFQNCMDVIVQAKNMFADMPARLRARFQNDPAKFLDFVNDIDNQDEAVRLGLATLKAPVAPLGEAGAIPGAAAAARAPEGRESGRQAHKRSRGATPHEHSHQNRGEDGQFEPGYDDHSH